ncbi:MAG: family 20 glycosylhydrolase [Bacteroidales bacterium]|nr:family 20 glycosylhydrolase [Bacteroidales bacterium]
MNTKTLLSIAVCLLATACAKPCRIVWTEGHTDPETGKTIHTMTIQNPPAGTDWTLWFSQFRTPVTMQEGAKAEILHHGGTLYRVAPTADAGGEDMVLRYEARALVNQCRAPEGFHLQVKGKKPVPVEVEYVFLPAEPVHSFDYTPADLTVYDMIPRLKKVEPLEGTTTFDDDDIPVFPAEGMPHGWYRIRLDGSIRIEFNDDDGAYYASVTLANLKRNAKDGTVPSAVIEDWPDLPYRGIMLDVSRNFTKKDDLLKLIDLLAHYKVNRLHLHFGDDEGWRVEMDGLPELTSYGAYRSIPTLNEDGTISEPDALFYSYCVTPDRNDTKTAGNGFYSKADYIQILKYAESRHMLVIPEFDIPGHSRAAVKSMEYRFRTTGDATYRLWDPADTSKYNSAQDYCDNVIDVSLPSTYAFIEKVFDNLIALHAEAGVPLEAIHIGGDEVPDGSWEGSPSCQALLAANGQTDVDWLKDYFTNRVLDIAEARGVKIAGWQEVAQHLQPATYERIKRNLGFTNFWAVSRGREKIGYTFANDGIPVVLSNSSNAYFDLAYNWSKTERGHSWAGFIDERRSFSFLPYDLYKSVRWDDKGEPTELATASEGKPALTPEGKPYILGVQGQLWSETLRNFDHVTYYLFPKALGLFERGWNASPVWAETTQPDDPAFVEDFDRFFTTIVEREYPYYESLGISWHRH